MVVSQRSIICTNSLSFFFILRLNFFACSFIVITPLLNSMNSDITSALDTQEKQQTVVYVNLGIVHTMTKQATWASPMQKTKHMSCVSMQQSRGRLDGMQ